MEELKSDADIGDDGDSVTDIDQELIKQRLEEHQNQLKTYLENNHSDATMKEIMGGREIKTEEYSILPASLPYKVEGVEKELAALNDSYRQELSLKVENKTTFDTINYQATIPELASKRISISYVAATEEDAETIKSYSSDSVKVNEPIDPSGLSSDVPANLINLKPQIRIDGEVKATGNSVMMGTRHDFQMEFSYPEQIGLGSSTINNEVTAGAQYVVTLDTGKVSQEQLNDKQIALKKAKTKLKNNSSNSPENLSREILHTIGLSYFAELDKFNNILERSNKVKATRITSLGITAIDLDVGYIYGMPKTASFGGMHIDIDKDSHVVQSIDGKDKKEKIYNKTSGMVSFYLEASIFEQSFGGEAISTMHILHYANWYGINIYIELIKVMLTA